MHHNYLQRYMPTQLAVNNGPLTLQITVKQDSLSSVPEHRKLQPFSLRKGVSVLCNRSPGSQGIQRLLLLSKRCYTAVLHTYELNFTAPPTTINKFALLMFFKLLQPKTGLLPFTGRSGMRAGYFHFNKRNPVYVLE